MNLIGKTLKQNQYEIIDLLGQGQTTAVYRAFHVAMNRYVAIKALPPQAGEDETAVERFLSEARKIADLNHPAILPIYDFGVEDGLAFIVMQLADGGTLADLQAQDEPLSLREANRITQRVAAGLGHAHKAGILHTNIKPQNILIDAKGEVYISDFGFADPTDDPTYMAPEQGMGEPFDRRADVYALGAVLYACLTGEAPYTGKTPAAVIYQHKTAPVPSARASIPARVDAVIQKAMAKTPDERFQTAGELAEALDTTVTLGRPAVPLPEAKDAAPRRTRRELGPGMKRLLALFVRIIGLLVLVAAVAVVALWALPALIQPAGQTPLFTWPADLTAVWDVAFSPDGERLATAGADGTVRIWNPATGQEVGVLRGHPNAVNAVAYRPDGDNLATAGADGTLRVWSAVTGEELLQLRGHQGAVLSAAYHPGGWQIATGGEDGVLRLWNLNADFFGALTGEEIGSLQTPGPVVDVAFSPDGKYLALVIEGTGIWLSEMAGRDLPQSAPAPLGEESAQSVAFDFRSDLVGAAMGEVMQVWQTRAAEQAFTLTDGGRPLAGAAFGPGGARVAAAHADGVVIWSLAAGEGAPGEVALRLTGDLGAVCGLAYSPRGDFVAAAGCDGRLHIWDMTRGGEVAVVSVPTVTPSLTSRPLPSPPTATPTATATLRPTSTVTPTPTVTLAPTPVLGQGIARQGEVALYEESFTGAANGWQEETTDEYQVEVKDGKLVVSMFETERFMWTSLQDEDEAEDYVFGDFVYSADVQLVEGTIENYGVVFRNTEDGDFYMAQLIDQDGFEFWEYRDGEMEMLIELMDVEAVKPPPQVNHLRIEAIGPWLSFFVNGKLVDTALMEDPLREGRIGIFLGSFQNSPDIVAHFDNLSVRDFDTRLYETFSDEAGGWAEEKGDEVERGYDDNTYRIQVLEPARRAVSFAAAEYTDVVMEVEISYEGEANVAGYGLVCRRQEDQMYETFIRSDGAVLVRRIEEFGGWVPLTSWEDVEAVQTGEETNWLRVACVGDTIAVAVNGVYLGRVTDGTYPTGQIGLSVDTFDEGEAEVRFDNLMVTGR